MSCANGFMSLEPFGSFWTVFKRVSMLQLFCDIFDSARYGLVDAYSSNGNVTEDEVFRGWPIEQHENRVWFLFGALWRVTWWDKNGYPQGDEHIQYSKQSLRAIVVFGFFPLSLPRSSGLRGTTVLVWKLMTTTQPCTPFLRRPCT